MAGLGDGFGDLGEQRSLGSLPCRRDLAKRAACDQAQTNDCRQPTRWRRFGLGLLSGALGDVAGFCGNLSGWLLAGEQKPSSGREMATAARRRVAVNVGGPIREQSWSAAGDVWLRPSSSYGICPLHFGTWLLAAGQPRIRDVPAAALLFDLRR